MLEQLNAKVTEGAGGIVERDTPSGPLIAVVYRERYGPEWSLPKGKRQNGESWQDAALREVKEETSVAATIIGIAGATAYLAVGVPKLVIYWRMRIDNDAPPFTANEEVKKLTWLTPAKAVERLSHAEEASLVRKLFGFTNAPLTWRFADRLDKQLVRIFRRRAVQRLAGDIAAYEGSVQGRAESHDSLNHRLPLIRDALREAREALDNGKIDQGWKCFQTAHHLELLGLDGSELKAEATAIRREADKLNVWRKNAVLDLLPVKDGEDKELAIRVFRAALLRDEHYNNEAYKDGLRRSNALRLAVVLGIVLPTLLLLARAGYLLGTDGANSFQDLLSMALVGLLGATISAITDAPTGQSTTRIPEMVSSIRVTALRLMMGPASAIVIYFVTKSPLYDAIFNFQLEGYALLAIAFVAGFTERLVLRVVEMITKSTA